MSVSDEGREPDPTRQEIRLFRRLVRPFYLKMYLVEAPAEVDPRAARRFRRRLVRAGRKVTSEQVEWLLQGRWGWRQQTMGAWFALAVPTVEVREALSGAWNSAGGHVGFPLATASALVAGSDAVAGMRLFAERIDAQGDPGIAGYVSAAIAHLGGSSPSDVDPMVAASLEDSLRIAAGLQSDFRTPRRLRWRTSSNS